MKRFVGDIVKREFFEFVPGAVKPDADETVAPGIRETRFPFVQRHGALQLIVTAAGPLRSAVIAQCVAHTDVVFAALTDEKHRGQVYEVTGPDLLSFRESIREIGEITNRKIGFQQVSMDDYVQFLSEAEVPEEFVGLLKYLFTEVLDGRNAYLTDGVKQALGREPRSFHSYAAVTAETGIWN